jgi:O-antigen/teichoic acid export membrane protein
VTSWLKNFPADRLRRLAKEGAWIVAGQIAAAIGSLVLVRVVSEYLAPAQYGQLSLALSLGTLVCQLTMAGAVPGIVRYFPVASERDDLLSYFRGAARLIGLATLATLVLGAAVAIGAGLWFGAAWVMPVGLATLFMLINNYNAGLSSIQNAARQRQVVALHSGLDPWLRVLAVLLVFLLAQDTELSALLGYLLAGLLVNASQLTFARRLIPPGSHSEASAERDWFSRSWTFSRPFVLMGLFGWAQANSDRWALQTFATTHEVGVYAALLQLGSSPIAIAIGLLVTFVGPILNQRAGDATDPTRTASAHRISLALVVLCLAATVVAALLAALLHGPIFSLLVASPYRYVSYLLPWVLLAGGLTAASQILTIKLMSEMNSHALVAPKVVTGLGGVALSFLGVRLGGLNGLVAASITFGVLQLMWLLAITTLPRRISSSVGPREGMDERDNASA